MDTKHVTKPLIPSKKRTYSSLVDKCFVSAAKEEENLSVNKIQIKKTKKKKVIKHSSLSVQNDCYVIL
jgi:hypothetical protein